MVQSAGRLGDGSSWEECHTNPQLPALLAQMLFIGRVGASTGKYVNVMMDLQYSNHSPKGK